MSNILSINGTPLTTTEEVDQSQGGYTALGTEGRKSVVFSHLHQNVFKLGPSELKEMGLKTVLGADWCDEHYREFDEKKEQMVFNHRRLATDIISACQRKGLYIQSTERRVGVWREDDGQLVVNSRELWRPTGTVIEHRIHEGRVYPASGDLGFDRHTEEATDDDVQRVLGAFGAIQWRQALGAELILGWLGIALLAGALPRRPHVMLAGAAGTGKSVILETVKWLLGRMAFVCTGPQTLAAIFQSLGGNSRAVVMDEFEADPKRRSSEDTLLAARLSYSMQEGDEGLVRGSVDGVAKSYNFQSAFIAAGVNPQLREPADIQRWVMLEATGRKADATRLTEVEAREIGPRLARRFTSRWGVFQASMNTVRECIIEAGGDGRMADTVGTLLASYWAFVSTQPATADDAKGLVEMLDIESRKAVHAASDEKRCLEALLSNVTPFRYMEGDAMVTRSLSVGEAVKRYCDNPSANVELLGRLTQLGLRAVNVKGHWRMYIANSPEHRGLRRLFSGTKWAAGGWSLVLRRLPGGEESTQRLGAGFPSCKVTVFDVPAELLPDESEGEMPLAA
ncbi:MAG: hypothetical protein IH627_10780 [Rubrivivax sp.]|nr:hypothetical protein [Rubrivivax sp.]